LIPVALVGTKRHVGKPNECALEVALPGDEGSRCGQISILALRMAAELLGEGVGRVWNRDGNQVYLAMGATHMRKVKALYGLGARRLQPEPLSGHVSLFCSI
jgi:hypothetical protein